MTAAGAYGIGWATHICDAQRNTVLEKVINIDWSHYPAGDFRAIDDTLNFEFDRDSTMNTNTNKGMKQ